MMRESAPARTERCAGEGELLFAHIHPGDMISEGQAGVNGQVLPVSCRFWVGAVVTGAMWAGTEPIARSLGRQATVAEKKSRF